MTRRSTSIANSVAIVCLSFVLLVSSAVVHAQTPQDVAQKAFAAVVLLVIENTSGQPVSLGSGFFIREGVIASNLHVVEGAPKGYARLVGQKAKLDIEGSVGVDPVHDLILLKVSGGPTAALTLGNSEAVQIGDTVYAVGNPQGVVGGQLTWDDDSHSGTAWYTLSFRNQLRESVSHISCLIVFYDATGMPIDTKFAGYDPVIPPGLATRVHGYVDGSVKRLTTPSGSMTPKMRVEFRILNFQIVE